MSNVQEDKDFPLDIQASVEGLVRQVDAIRLGSLPEADKLVEIEKLEDQIRTLRGGKPAKHSGGGRLRGNLPQ